MRHHDHLGALADQRLDRRCEPFDTGRVCDHAVLDRHVQIGAQQHPLAMHVDVVEGLETCHGVRNPSGEGLKLYPEIAVNSRATMSGCEVSVRLAYKNQDSEDRQIKAKGRPLSIPRGRLPHLKPLAADHHETEEPDEKSERGADEHKALAAVELVRSGPQPAK